MRTLRVALAAASAVVVGWVFTASADIPASLYVQEGLVAQFDGIENAGAGQPHSASPSGWTDITGGSVGTVPVCLPVRLHCQRLSILRVLICGEILQNRRDKDS